MNKINQPLSDSEFLIALDWWDSLEYQYSEFTNNGVQVTKQEELTDKYFPRFSVSMIDGPEVEEMYIKENN